MDIAFKVDHHFCLGSGMSREALGAWAVTDLSSHARLTTYQLRDAENMNFSTSKIASILPASLGCCDDKMGSDDKNAQRSRLCNLCLPAEVMVTTLWLSLSPRVAQTFRDSSN